MFGNSLVTILYGMDKSLKEVIWYLNCADSTKLHINYNVRFHKIQK